VEFIKSSCFSVQKSNQNGDYHKKERTETSEDGKPLSTWRWWIVPMLFPYSVARPFHEHIPSNSTKYEHQRNYAFMLHLVLMGNRGPHLRIGDAAGGSFFSLYDRDSKPSEVSSDYEADDNPSGNKNG
jgi:hypothetical protein